MPSAKKTGDARVNSTGEARPLPGHRRSAGQADDHDHGRSRRSADCRPTYAEEVKERQQPCNEGQYPELRHRLCRYDQEGIWKSFRNDQLSSAAEIDRSGGHLRKPALEELCVLVHGRGWFW